VEQVPYAKIEPLKRILRKVFKTETCWYWLGCLSKQAYSKTNLGSKYISAHALMWELTTGKRAPKGSVLMHSCDTPFCVNPSHLTVGSYSQNTSDAHAKGRWENGKEWDREKANVFIHYLLAVGDMTQRAIAKSFGVSEHVISNIARGNTWKNITLVEA
jgi:hypothetical protein